MCRVHCDLRTKLWPSGMSRYLPYSTLSFAVLGNLALDDIPLGYVIYFIYKSPLYCRPYMLAMGWSMSRDTVPNGSVLSMVFRFRFRQRPKQTIQHGNSLPSCSSVNMLYPAQSHAREPGSEYLAIGMLRLPSSYGK